MKMIRAIVRPEREVQVVQALERIGEYALTKVAVTGRGRQGGLQSGPLSHAEIAKVMFIIVVAEERADAIVTTIAHAAYTGFPGDGRIFVSPVEKAVRLRTGEILESSNSVLENGHVNA
ncbi:MAG: P-II family nitrogen regulator [Candidatus Sumerlaeaceae bacterium]